jgi:hypothetical protein
VSWIWSSRRAHSLTPLPAQPLEKPDSDEGTSKNTKASALTEPLHDTLLLTSVISRIKLGFNTFFPVAPDDHNGYLSRLVLISAELPSRYQKMWYGSILLPQFPKLYEFRWCNCGSVLSRRCVARIYFLLSLPSSKAERTFKDLMITWLTSVKDL